MCTEDQLFYVGVKDNSHRKKLEQAIKILKPRIKKKPEASSSDSNASSTSYVHNVPDGLHFPTKEKFMQWSTQELCEWLLQPAVSCPKASALCEERGHSAATLLEMVADEEKGVASLADMLHWMGVTVRIVREG